MLKRTLAFLAAVAGFAGVLAILGFLNGLPTGKEKKALARIRLEEESLSKSFEVQVLRSGFQRKPTGERDIYVPCLFVQIVNSSGQGAKPATLRGIFLRNGQSFCGAAGSVPALDPGAGCELWLKCIELTGFASVARGLSLAETTEPMEYEVVLESGRASVVAARDKLRSVLF